MIGCPLVHTIFVVLPYRPVLIILEGVIGGRWPKDFFGLGLEATAPSSVLRKASGLPWRLGGGLGYAPEHPDANS